LQLIANTKPAWKVPPKLEIYRALAATPSYGLANLIIVDNGQLSTTAPIRHTEKARIKIGKKMPRGVGIAEKVYIHVQKEMGMWKVYGVYLEDGLACFLWEQEEPPNFIPAKLAY
jgi:hypothetical protein